MSRDPIADDPRGALVLPDLHDVPEKSGGEKHLL